MLKVAIIGAGVMGTLHARTYRGLPNVKLAAICDIDRSRGGKLADFYKVRLYRDYKKMLAEENLDGVSITVPTNLHKEIALFVINKGVNLLIEKPLAATAEDAETIVNSANKRGIILTVGHIERFNPAVIKLKGLIKKGIFGDIVSIVVKRVGLFPPRVTDINVVTDLAVHDLDIVCDLLDKSPESIFAIGGKGINSNNIDYADIFLDFGKTSCYLQVNWMTPIKIRTLSVTGTLGYGELDYVTQELTLYKSNLTKIMPQQFEKFVAKLGKPKKHSIKIRKEEPLKLEIIDFLKCMERKQKPKVSGQEGMEAIKLSEAVLQSLGEKRPIHIM